MNAKSQYLRPAAAALTTAAVVLALVAAGALLHGCSSNGGSDPVDPNGMLLTVSAERVQVTRTVEVTAVHTYPYARANSPSCDWYVNGILGGNPASGSITQTNPATYTAPPAVPGAGSVVVSAISRSDSTFTAQDTLDIAFTIRYVDPDEGSDLAGGGAWTNRLRTISFALGETEQGDTVFVFPGTYDPDNGEGDHYTIPLDVTLRGESRDACFIAGSGDNYSLIWMNDGATVEGFTLINTLDEQIGILAEASGTIRDIATDDWFDHSAIRVKGPNPRDGEPFLIEDCVIVNESSPHSDRGMELIDGTDCIVRNCTVSGWAYGVFINEDSDPLIEGCTFTGNNFGMILFGGSGMLTEPDLGGGARGGAGGNTFRDNVDVGLSNGTEATIWALYNTWGNDPPTEGPPYPSDFQNFGGGSIIWTR